MRDPREDYVKIIAAGFVLGGVLDVLLFFNLRPLVELVAYLVPELNTWLFSVLILGLLAVVAGIALWLLQNWGRILGVVLAAIGLLGALWLGVAVLSQQTMLTDLAFLTSSTLTLATLSPVGFAMASGGFLGGLLVLGLGKVLPFLLLVLDILAIWVLLRPDVAELFSGAIGGGARVPQSSGDGLTVPQYPEPGIRASVPPPPPPTDLVDKPFRPVAWLIVRKGPREGQEFGLKRGTSLVGRHSSKCDVVLDDGTVGREHAKLRFEGGRFWIYDLGSKNGTYVNNRKVQKQMLMDGDQILLGETTLVFKEAR